MSQAADVHEGPGSPSSPAAILHAEPGCLSASRTAPLVHGVSATHAATRASNVSAANEHEQAGFRGQVADASRNASFGECPTIASLPTVTALRSHGTRYP